MSHGWSASPTPEADPLQLPGRRDVWVWPFPLLLGSALSFAKHHQETCRDPGSGEPPQLLNQMLPALLGSCIQGPWQPVLPLFLLHLPQAPAHSASYSHTAGPCWQAARPSILLFPPPQVPSSSQRPPRASPLPTPAPMPRSSAQTPAPLNLCLQPLLPLPGPITLHPFSLTKVNPLPSHPRAPKSPSHHRLCSDWVWVTHLSPSPHCVP